MNNVILITVDALRKDMLGIYNEKSNLSPFLDSLKDSSAIFCNAFSSGPYTQSSFQGILASEYYLEYGKEKKLNPKKILVSQVLKENGIYTAGFHSNAYLSYYFGYKKGWDTFYDSMEEEVTDMYPFTRGGDINNKVEEFLKNYSFGKPLFLWVHYMDVHEPYIAENNYLSKIDPDLKISKDEMFSLFRDVLHKRDISDGKKVDILKKIYMAKVIETDSYIKNLFSIFSKYNLLNNSTFIMASDHGDEFSEHGGLSHDGKMYNELVTVPLLFYKSSYEGKIKEPVSLIDIPPTICDIFGIEASPTFKGSSLLPLGERKNKDIFGEAINKIGHQEKETDKPIYFTLDNNIKVIYRKEGDTWEAYNLLEDKSEKENIIGKVDKNLKDKLKDFINRKRGE
jgi:arylsulfatase A-like enzyme